MTREEAIAKLDELRDEVYNEDSDGYSYAQAIDLAIESLQTENKPQKVIANIKVDTEEVVRRIKEEYDITDGWIPCSERLPEKGKQVLCCNKNGSVFTSAITYLNSNGMVAFGQHYGVIAWMPLPKPYKGGDEE